MSLLGTEAWTTRSSTYLSQPDTPYRSIRHRAMAGTVKVLKVRHRMQIESHRPWRQEQIAENAEKISQLGRELFERMRTLVEHLGNVGAGLGRAVDSYNKAVGSLESRVLPSARRFQDLRAATGEEIKELQPIERSPRLLETLPDDVAPE